MSDFDPYYEWLGIPPKDQPPNHYRLLGIDLFECNPKVIASAADRQMAFLRTFQIGPRSKETQKLLTEVAAAEICLLDADERALYDERLRASILPTVAPSRQRRPKQTSSRRVTLLTVQMVLGAVGGLAAGAVILEYGFGVANPLGLRGESHHAQSSSQPRLSDDEKTETKVARRSLMPPVTKRNAAPERALSEAPPPSHDEALPEHTSPTVKSERAGNEGRSQATERDNGTSPLERDTPSPAPDVVSPPGVDVRPPDVPAPVDSNEHAEEPKSEPKNSEAKPAAEKPVAVPKERGAVVMVAVPGMVAVPIRNDQRFPAALHGGQTFTWAKQPAISDDNATLAFAVMKSGYVYLTADWNRQGNSLGGWQKTCLSKEQLIAGGWEHLGRCPWEGDDRKPIELFRKHCTTGDQYQIRVNKYWPPKLYIPPAR